MTLIVSVGAVGTVMSASGADERQVVVNMTGSAIVLMAGPVIWAWVSPRRGLVDWLVGTTVARR